jgi:hypothetical protein
MGMPRGHRADNPRNKERDDRIEALWIAGMKGKAIGMEVGCSRSAVLGVVWRRGLVGNPLHPPLRINPPSKGPDPVDPTPSIDPTPEPLPRPFFEPLPEPEDDVPDGFVSIITIRMDQCRWLIDGVRYHGLPVFCGKPVDPRTGRLWCPVHHKKAVSVPHYHQRAKEQA